MSDKKLTDLSWEELLELPHTDPRLAMAPTPKKILKSLEDDSEDSEDEIDPVSEIRVQSRRSWMEEEDEDQTTVSELDDSRQRMRIIHNQLDIPEYEDDYEYIEDKPKESGV